MIYGCRKTLILGLNLGLKSFTGFGGFQDSGFRPFRVEDSVRVQRGSFEGSYNKEHNA